MSYQELNKEQLLQLVIERDNEILQKDQQVVKSENKAVSYKGQLDLTNKYPDIALKRAEMEYYLELAAKFVKSGAFKFSSPEECYVIMKAGQDMGLSEIESMQSLYIVNGTIKFYGDKMISMFTKMGYTIEYIDETKVQVTAKITAPDGKVYTEIARADDQIIQKSKAASFALKNKLRFHAIRMIASFHLPHLFSSVSDGFTNDFHEYEEITSNKNGAQKTKEPNSEELSIESVANQPVPLNGNGKQETTFASQEPNF